MIKIKSIEPEVKKVDKINARLYFVSCDNPKIFKQFIDNIRKSIIGVVYKDYDYVKFKAVNRLTPIDYNTANSKFIQRIVKIVNKKNNSIYKELISEINTNNYNRNYIFVRVDNLHTLNRLKRLYKRPNYKTLRISHTQDISNKLKLKYKEYHFDSKIEYYNDKHFKHQVRQFIRNYIPTIKVLHNK